MSPTGSTHTRGASFGKSRDQRRVPVRASSTSSATFSEGSPPFFKGLRTTT